MSSWRPSTQKQYGPYIRQWMEFCSKRSENNSSPNLGTVIEFLTSLFDRNLGYSVVNTARSALSCILYTESGQTIGRHPMIVRFMKGVFEKSLPRNNVTWDTKIVLSYLRTLSPPAKLALKMLTFKTVTLVALLSAQRAQTIHLLSLENMTVTSSFYKFRIAKPIKTTKPGKHIQEIEFAAYPEDKAICIVTTLKEYIKRTEKLRGQEKALFISFSKPYNVVSKSTISRWVKTTLQNAGIDMNIFTPHSTRAAATSKVQNTVSLETILKTAAWSQESTFRKFYNKPIHNTGEFGFNILENS